MQASTSTSTSTSTEYRVAEAQVQLASALEAQRRHRRGELVQQLADARKQLREANATYKRLALQVKTEREQRAFIQSKLDQIFAAIDDSWSQRPAVATYLPNDPDVVAWQQQYSALKAERDKLIAERNAILPSDVMAAVRYEGPTGIVARLQHLEASLLEQVERQVGCQS
jgi:chromosome segregation ATPase